MLNKDKTYWARRQIECPEQYLCGVLRGTDHLILHETCHAALSMARELAQGEWLEAVEVVPQRVGVFSHFILDAQAYSLYPNPADAAGTDRSGWSKRRLQNTEAYLRHTINEGSRIIYDAEEMRLLWLDIKAELDKRKGAE